MSSSDCIVRGFINDLALRSDEGPKSGTHTALEDEIGAPAQFRLQIIGESNELRQQIHFRPSELDDEIEVAPLGIELGGIRGTEHFELGHAIFPAKLSDCWHFRFENRVHVRRSVARVVTPQFSHRSYD